MYTTLLGNMTKKVMLHFIFSHLDPRNAVVPLMMMLASCNTSAKTSSVI